MGRAGTPLADQRPEPIGKEAGQTFLSSKEKDRLQRILDAESRLS